MNPLLPIQRQIRQAQLRLSLQRLLTLLPRCLSATLLVAVAVMLVDKAYPLPWQTWHTLAAAALAAVVATLLATVLARPSGLDAAVEIDRRFGLKERVSSSLALSETDRSTPAGHALVDDAVRKASRLQLGERFTLKLDRWALLPLGPALLAFLVAVLVPDWVEPAPAAQADAAIAKQVQQESEALRKKLIERRRQAEQLGLTEAEQLFEQLQRETQPMAEGQERNREQALVKLNDLSRQMQERQRELVAGEQLKQQLNQLKNMQDGPAKKFAEALRQGDFAQAADQLKQLREQLENSQLDDEARKKLAEQLADIEERLQEMAAAHQKKQEQLKQQIEENRAAGREDAARQLEEQLSQLKQQQPQMDQLSNLANQLGQCSKCMQQGDQEGAAASLSDLEQQLSSLERESAEMEMLESALDEISQCKGGMCQGPGQKPGNGDGLGRGRGQGDRPEEETETASYDTRVKQKTGEGAAIVTGLAEGPNAKGQITQQIKEQVQAGRSDRADPLTDQPLPRGFREHAREYFDALREGENQ